MLAAVLADIRVPRIAPGRPRTRPGAVIADKAYSAGTYRRTLRARRIAVVIPQESDEIVVRKRRGSRGGRPPSLDTDTYRRRNVVERHFALTRQWRGLATRYDKLAITYRAAVILAACLTRSRVMGDMPWTSGPLLTNRTLRPIRTPAARAARARAPLTRPYPSRTP